MGTPVGRSPAVATLLSLAWPGLGQAYRGDRRRALTFALPPLMVAVAIGSLVLLVGPAVFVAHLLNPIFAAAAGLLVLGAALWWTLAIADAGRPHSRTSLVAAAAALALVLFTAGWSGQVVWSLFEAGQRISQPLPTAQPAPRPTTPSATAPGGPTPLSPGPTGPTGPATPPPTDPPTPSPSPSPLPALDGRVTVLFLGWDLGRGPEGQLTDTIQVASFDPDAGHIAVVSIPRDTGQLPMYDGGTWKRKINELMSYAEAHPDEYPDGGLTTLMRQAGHIVGVPVDYYAAVDFAGFVELIDLVGGVDVVLDRPIADPTYLLVPNRPRGFFLEPGEHHLDGRTALAYVRSRYGPGNSDWQRARRQQQVLLQLRHKIEDPRVLARLPELVDAASRMVRTNASLDRLPQIVALVQASTAAQAETYVLQPREFAEVIPRSEIGSVYMTRLKMDAVAELSIRLFGEDSRYAQP